MGGAPGWQEREPRSPCRNCAETDTQSLLRVPREGAGGCGTAQSPPSPDLSSPALQPSSHRPPPFPRWEPQCVQVRAPTWPPSCQPHLPVLALKGGSHLETSQNWVRTARVNREG